MRPIQEQSIEEKARLLHQLLPGEVRGFLAGLHHYAQQTIKDMAANDINIPDNTSGVNWLEWATQIEESINKFYHQLATLPQFFAQELFIGPKAAFTLDYMQKHAAITGYRFRDAIKFLFDLKPYGKLPFQEDEK